MFCFKPKELARRLTGGCHRRSPFIYFTIKVSGRRCFLLEVTVHQNQVDKALKALKRQMTKEGLLKELKRRRFYEKPSVKKKRKQKEAKKKRKSALRRSFV